ncbi:hypothetical protein BV20DRAFT_823674 [Pilatotrama ljubarskyi]|nr:hypothetical protein BV20DRAFT_823674 [Pilatotrama ljubarskyi]
MGPRGFALTLHPTLVLSYRPPHLRMNILVACIITASTASLTDTSPTLLQRDAIYLTVGTLHPTACILLLLSLHDDVEVECKTYLEDHITSHSPSPTRKDIANSSRLRSTTYTDIAAVVRCTRSPRARLARLEVG